LFGFLKGSVAVIKDEADGPDSSIPRPKYIVIGPAAFFVIMLLAGSRFAQVDSARVEVFLAVKGDRSKLLDKGKVKLTTDSGYANSATVGDNDVAVFNEVVYWL
jgi:hypothetical protein